ncbi:MAG: hypothetical protein ACOC6A_05660 [Chloroflexota bacterium]
MRFAVGDVFRRTALGLLVLSAGVVAGCAGDQWEAEEKVAAQGVEMHLWLDATTLSPGDTLTVRTEVKNTSGQEVEYTMWNIGDPAVYIGVDTPHGTTVSLRGPDEPEIVQPAVTFDSLDAGEGIEREVTWTVSEQDPNGTYTVEASFFPGRQIEQEEPEPVALTHDVEVQGSFSVMGKEEVYDIATANPSVELWLRGHTGDAVAREQKGDYRVNMAGEWERANRELYEQALDAARPPALSLELGETPRRWQVTYSSKFGFPPSEITVSMDAETGEIISVAPDLRAELDGGVVATFEVQNARFRAFVVNEQAIEELYALQRGESRANIPVSRLERGPGAGMHNAPWSWHLDPQQFGLAEMTIEVCDGTPQFVEEELDYWLDQVGQYCPWSAELVGIEDYR